MRLDLTSRWLLLIICVNIIQASLVVTNWKMIETNGLLLINRIAENDEEIQVMLISAYELEQDQLKEVNKNDYLKSQFIYRH